MYTPDHQYECVNESEPFWKRFYLVSFASCLGYNSSICVNADNERDALDEAADYAEEKGWIGYFLERDDSYTQELESFDEVDYVGNHCLPVQSSEIHIVEIDAQYVTFKPM